VTQEQTERLLDQLERIADALEALSELTISTPTLRRLDREDAPALLVALDHIADMSGLGK
jgi:hypothetical protein